MKPDAERMSIEVTRKGRAPVAAAVLGLLIVLAAGVSRESSALATRPGESAAARGPTGQPLQALAARSLEGWPLVFEPASGRSGQPSSFRSRGPGYTLGLDGGTATLILDRPTRGRDEKADAPVSLRIRLAGAGQSRGQGLDPLTARANYFVGPDRSRWRTEVPLFGRVRYPGVYPGVDLVYYGRNGEIEHDFLLAPGADPRRIEFAFDGADAIRISGRGDLVLTVKGEEVLLRKPVAHQQAGDAHHEVAAAFETRPHGRFGFALGEYDAAAPLVIDPVISYSTYLGGSTQTDNGALAVYDAAGFVYVLGTSSSFPVTAGAYDTASSGIDVFLAKMNPRATGAASLVYATYLGGTYSDGAGGLAVDAQGNVYVSVAATSGFPATTGAYDTTYNGGQYDIGVAKLSPAGSALVWSTFLGGSYDEGSSTLAIDLSGAVVVAGYTQSLDFPTTATAYRRTILGPLEGFVTVINPTGGGLIYSTYYGGSGTQDIIGGVAVDGLGRIYVCGTTASADLPTTQGAFDTTLSGTEDGFVACFDITQTGSASLSWATYLGGSGADRAVGIVLASGDEPVVYGGTSSADFPSAGTGYDGSLSGPDDLCLARLSNDGSSVLWATYLGGSSSDSGSVSIAQDLLGRTHLTGNTLSSNFPATAGAIKACQSSDAFYTVLDTSVGGTSSLIASTCLAQAWGLGIGVNACGSASITGFTTSAVYPTVGAYSASLGGPRDAFLMELSNPSGAGNADLRVAVGDSPDPVVAGLPVIHTIQVTNDGPDAATGVRLRHSASAIVDAASLPAECSASGSVVTCELGTIASGATVPLAITSVPPIPGTLWTATLVGAVTDDGDCADNGAAASTAVKGATLNLDSPNGGEILAAGSIVEIGWSAPATAATFNLDYTVDNGGTWKSVAKGIGGRSYAWQVPSQKGTKTKCKVRVKAFTALSKAAGFDISDAPFTIEVLKLDTPNGGGTLVSGGQTTISWTTRQTLKPAASAKLLYTINGGSSWVAIATLTGNPGSYAWTVPSVPGVKTKCKVRVLLKDAAGATLGKDDSDLMFTISP